MFQLVVFIYILTDPGKFISLLLDYRQHSHNNYPKNLISLTKIQIKYVLWNSALKSLELLLLITAVNMEHCR